MTFPKVAQLLLPGFSTAQPPITLADPMFAILLWPSDDQGPRGTCSRSPLSFLFQGLRAAKGGSDGQPWPGAVP